MNWRSYGLSQMRGQLPRGAITLIVHWASVWARSFVRLTTCE